MTDEKKQKKHYADIYVSARESLEKEKDKTKQGDIIQKYMM